MMMDEESKRIMLEGGVYVISEILDAENNNVIDLPLFAKRKLESARRALEYTMSKDKDEKV